MTQAKIKIVVFKEHTLGYILPQLPKYIQVLHASVLRGAINDGSHGGLLIHSDNDWRLADRSDFEAYRVCIDGYLNDVQYEFNRNTK